MELITHVIDGEDVESESGAKFDSVDPYTRTAYAEVALGGQKEVDRAVASARRAFDEGPWPRMGYAERGALLHRLADLVVEHGEELALADVTDMGKPISDARTRDVPRTAQNLRFFADHARLATGETFPMDSGHHAYSLFQPAGVVAAISPWNFPLMLESWKIAPALAWGNTVVLKPAEDTPKSATLLARLATEAGLPPGVLNVVHGFGPDSAGSALTQHRGVDRITFTGESGTARVIGQAAAANLTPVSFELGGKGANLVFDDADLDNAVAWSIKAIFTNAGQVCLAGSRLFVQRGVYDEFVARFVAAAEALHAGRPEGPGHRARPARLGGALEEGDRLPRRHLPPAPGGCSPADRTMAGSCARPWSSTHPWTPGSSARRCSARVVTIHPFDTEEEAVRIANDSPYGLNAMVFTENLSRAHRVSAALKAGTVWVNCFFIRDLRAPFGGVGDSGVGREGGTFSREFFTEPKAVVMQI